MMETFFMSFLEMADYKSAGLNYTERVLLLGSKEIGQIRKWQELE